MGLRGLALQFGIVCLLATIGVSSTASDFDLCSDYLGKKFGYSIDSKGKMILSKYKKIQDPQWLGGRENEAVYFDQEKLKLRTTTEVKRYKNGGIKSVIVKRVPILGEVSDKDKRYIYTKTTEFTWDQQAGCVPIKTTKEFPYRSAAKREKVEFNLLTCNKLYSHRQFFEKSEDYDSEYCEDERFTYELTDAEEASVSGLKDAYSQQQALLNKGQKELDKKIEDFLNVVRVSIKETKGSKGSLEGDRIVLCSNADVVFERRCEKFVDLFKKKEKDFAFWNRLEDSPEQMAGSAVGGAGSR